jgi:Arc/MetJ family transcription regulator
VYIFYGNGVYMAPKRTGTVTSIRLDKKLADQAAKAYGVKTRTEAVHLALLEVVRLRDFKKLMKEYGGKLKFENYDK